MPAVPWDELNAFRRQAAWAGLLRPNGVDLKLISRPQGDWAQTAVDRAIAPFCLGSGERMFLKGREETEFLGFEELLHHFFIHDLENCRRPDAVNHDGSLAIDLDRLFVVERQ